MERSFKTIMKKSNRQDYSVKQIDSEWSAVDRATLLFVMRDGQVLLIRKKRGLGAGKINGPGGKLDKGETPLQAAVREISEELCVTVSSATFFGELRFQFVDGYSIHVYVFMSDSYSGNPTETAEAIPLWCGVDDIPYDEMWADDRIWLPRVLAGESVDGRFVFDGDIMLEHDVQFGAAPLAMPE